MGVKVERAGRIDQNAEGLRFPKTAQTHRAYERKAPGLKRTELKKRSDRWAENNEEQFGGAHGEWIRGLPCHTCFPNLYPTGGELKPFLLQQGMPRRSHASHVGHGRGAGGKAWDMIPQCPPHHDEYEAGRETFCETYGTTLDQLSDAAHWLHDVSPALDDASGAAEVRP
jgi:hypothetical protein